MKKYLRLIILIGILLTVQIQSSAICYQSTNDLEGHIKYESREHHVNQYVLEALTKTIMNDKGILGGFWGMQIGFYDGMSAESLASSLANVCELCATANRREKQESIANEKKYTKGDYEDIITNIQSPCGNSDPNSGKAYFMKTLKEITPSKKK